MIRWSFESYAYLAQYHFFVITITLKPLQQQ